MLKLLLNAFEFKQIECIIDVNDVKENTISGDVQASQFCFS